MATVEYFDDEKNNVSPITPPAVHNPHRTLKDRRSDVKFERKPPEGQWSRWHNPGNVSLAIHSKVML